MRLRGGLVMSIHRSSLELCQLCNDLNTFGSVHKLSNIVKEDEISKYVSKLRSTAYDLAVIKDSLYWNDIAVKVKQEIIDQLFKKLPKIPDLGLPKINFRNLLQLLPSDVALSCVKISLGVSPDLNIPLDWLTMFELGDLSFIDLSKLVHIMNKIAQGVTDFSLSELSLIGQYFPDYDLSNLLPVIDKSILDLFLALPSDFDIILELPDGMQILNSIYQHVSDFLDDTGELDLPNLLNYVQTIVPVGEDILDLLSSKLSLKIIDQLGDLLNINPDITNTLISCLKYYRTRNFYDLVVSLCRTTLAANIAEALGVNPETFRLILSTTTNVVSLVHGILSGNPMTVISALDSLGAVNKLLNFFHIPRATFDTVVAILSAICSTNPITASLGLLLYFCGGTLVGAVFQIYQYLKDWDISALLKYCLAYGELLAACLTEALGKILGLFGTPDEASWTPVKDLFDTMGNVLKQPTKNSYVRSLIAHPMAQGYDEVTSSYLLFYDDKTTFYKSKYAVR